MMHRFLVLLCTIVAVTAVQGFAAGNRYVYGDVNGPAPAVTVQAPRPMMWSMFATDSVKGKAGDSSYLGSTSQAFYYNLGALDTSLEPDAPRNYSGFGFYWAGNKIGVNLTGATFLKFAYKLPDATHKLVVNISCIDSLQPVDTTFATRSTYVRDSIPGGVGTAGKPGWVVDSIPVSAFGDSLIIKSVNGVVFMVEYADTSIKTSTTGILRLDEVYFKDVASVGIKMLPVSRMAFSGSSIFNDKGVAVIEYYSMQGEQLATHSVAVKAGQSALSVAGDPQAFATGTYLVTVKGPGVNFNQKIIQ